MVIADIKIIDLDFYPARMRKGVNVIGRVIDLYSTKIARSGHLGICATHNQDISVAIVEKLALLRFEYFKLYERSKRCVLLTTPITTAQQAMCF